MRFTMLFLMASGCGFGLDPKYNEFSDAIVDEPASEPSQDNQDQTTPTGNENPFTDECGDGIDNDNDGLIDCLDVDCNNISDWCIDMDGDGSPRAEDCNDASASTYPGANDIAGDGIDQDCDGVDAGNGNNGGGNNNTDADGDGYTSAQGDCNDNDYYINPGANDYEGDGVDANCDGVDGNAGSGGSQGQEICSDNIDNDNDGLTDCDDIIDCALDIYCLLGGGNNGGGSNGGGGNNNAGEDCTNGIDDNGDGAIDCDDWLCFLDVNCLTGGGNNGGGNNGGGNNGGGNNGGGSSNLCSDDCVAWAGDGVCDDGGSGADYDLCLLGTDCTDCGVRIDADNDGFDAGWDCDDTDPSTLSSDFDNDYYSDCIDDCDDGDAYVNPGETEVLGDGIDNDCDGVIDGSGGGNNGGGNNGGGNNGGGSSSGQACDDTCIYANDGVCDDGGVNSTDDSCDFGTDCNDCGSRSVCEDSCVYANDGVCDDGGPNASYSVCDRGTDCADCGAYPTSSGGSSGGSTGSCCFTLEMSDSWGDGWNGSYMESEANGVAIGTHELTSGSSGTEQICMNSGDNFTLDFVSVGIYDSEISYDLLDANNSSVASGSNPSNGSIYSESNVCP